MFTWGSYSTALSRYTLCIRDTTHTARISTLARYSGSQVCVGVLCTRSSTGEGEGGELTFAQNIYEKLVTRNFQRFNDPRRRLVWRAFSVRPETPWWINRLTSMIFLLVRDSWGSLYSVYLRRTLSMSVLAYWYSLLLELKIISAISQSHSTDNSYAFFITPNFLLLKVTCRI